MKAFLAGLVFAVIFAPTALAQRGRVDLKKPLRRESRCRVRT